MIKGIILSAGKGSRMGKQKLLLPLKGHTVVEEVITKAKSSMIDEVLLVYGEPRQKFEEICFKHNIKGIYNENYEMGQSQSIIRGIEASKDADGYIFLLGDQPMVQVEIVNKIIYEHMQFPESIIVPVYGEKKGNPVLFPLLFKEELLNITGDSGGREIIRKNSSMVREVQQGSFDAFFDIDVISDYEYVKGVMENSNENISRQ